MNVGGMLYLCACVANVCSFVANVLLCVANVKYWVKVAFLCMYTNCFVTH